MIPGKTLGNIDVVSSLFRALRRDTEATQGKSVAGSERKCNSLDIQNNALSITMNLTCKVSPKTKGS